MNNLFLIGIGLICRWRIYKGHYGHLFDDLTPEQALEVKKATDAYRHEMKDNGGYFLSLWKEVRRHGKPE